MTRILVLFMTLMFAAPSVWAADNGLINKKSPYSVKKTLNRLEKILRSKVSPLPNAGAMTRVAKRPVFHCAQRNC